MNSLYELRIVKLLILWCLFVGINSAFTAIYFTVPNFLVSFIITAIMYLLIPLFVIGCVVIIFRKQDSLLNISINIIRALYYFLAPLCLLLCSFYPNDNYFIYIFCIPVLLFDIYCRYPIEGTLGRFSVIPDDELSKKGFVFTTRFKYLAIVVAEWKNLVLSNYKIIKKL